MPKSLKEKVLEIAGLVYDLNKNTKDEWFFDYSGHINSISVNYRTDKKCSCSKCGVKEKESIYLSYTLNCNLHTPLNDLIKKLKSYK